MVYEVVKDGVTVCVPDNDLLPDQPPEAVQLSALVEVQERIEELPWFTKVGLALMLTVGSTCCGCTETVTRSDA